MKIKIHTLIFWLAAIFCAPTFADMVCTASPDGSISCTGTYTFPAGSSGILGALTLPAWASTQGSTPSAEAMRNKECGEKKGAALGRRAACRADRTADRSDNNFQCPAVTSVVTTKINSDGSTTVTTSNPRQVCLDHATDIYNTGMAQCESDYLNTSLPSGCKLD